MSRRKSTIAKPRPGYCKNGSIDLRKLPVIVYKPLGRHGAHGMAYQDLGQSVGFGSDGPPTIELDVGLRGRRHLEVAIHEALHLACPFMYEPVVTATAIYLSRVLWKLGFRHKGEIDND